MVKLAIIDYNVIRIAAVFLDYQYYVPEIDNYLQLSK